MVYLMLYQCVLKQVQIVTEENSSAYLRVNCKKNHVKSWQDLTENKETAPQSVESSLHYELAF